VVSVNKTNSSLGLAIKALDPVHTSYDMTSGKIESGKIFTQLGINLDEIPDAEAVVSKFLARSKKRPASITELAVAALSRAPLIPIPSEVPSGTELEVEDGDEAQEGGEMKGGDDRKASTASEAPPKEEVPPADEAPPVEAAPEEDMAEETEEEADAPENEGGEEEE